MNQILGVNVSVKFSSEQLAMCDLVETITREIERYRKPNGFVDYEEIKNSGYNMDERNYRSLELVDDVFSPHWDNFELHERYYHTITDFEARYAKKPRQIIEGILSVQKKHLEQCLACNQYYMGYHNGNCTKANMSNLKVRTLTTTT